MNLECVLFIIGRSQIRRSHKLLNAMKAKYKMQHGDYSVSVDAKEEFKKILLQTIDENLKQIFQETATHIIYQFLENNYSLKREEIPEKLETFMEGLQEFFRSGAHVIEQSILKELYSNLGLEYKSREGCRFLDYIDDLENVYQATRNPPKSRWLQRASPKT